MATEYFDGSDDSTHPSPSGYWTTNAQGENIFVVREDHPEALPKNADFNRMEEILLNAGIFHETWKDEVGHIYITTGGKGMDVELQFDAGTGKLTRIESLKE